MGGRDIASADQACHRGGTSADDRPHVALGTRGRIQAIIPAALALLARVQAVGACPCDVACRNPSMNRPNRDCRLRRKASGSIGFSSDSRLGVQT